MMRGALRAGMFLLTVASVSGIAISARSPTASSASKTAPPFVPEPVPALPALADRVPAVPVPKDKTVLNALPDGLRLQIPAGTARPLRTNEWWSNGMLEAWPSPLFAWPLVGSIAADGLTLSVPGKTVADRAIVSAFRDPLRIHADAPATGARAVSAGEWDVTFRLAQGAKRQFDATLIQGSPFAFIRGQEMLTVALPNAATTEILDCTGRCGSALLVRAAQTTYLLASASKNAFEVANGTVRARMDGGFLTAGAIAPGSDPMAYLSAAMRPYAGTQSNFSVQENRVRTTFRFPRPTLMGVFPHQQSALERRPGAILGTFETIRGPVRIYAGQAFKTSLTRPMVLPALPPVAALRNDGQLATVLKQEASENRPLAGDIYGAAKDLLRKAMLIEVADGIGDTARRDEVLRQVRLHLQDWCTASGAGDRDSLAYDAIAGGIVALPPAFGSERYNDHHFHYGYFLHAAAIVARFDQDFERTYGDCMRLLARDIASLDRADPSFPFLRYFDTYAGHSWANGLAPFGDGNNQESVSEAMHAWYGMALYGWVTGNKSMEDEGTWLLAQEAHAARTYWLPSSSKKGVLAGFKQPMISLLWGGKVDYATFFDASDAAIRGIQFFPTTLGLLPLIDEKMTDRVVTPARVAGGNTIWTSTLRLVEGVYSPADLPENAPIDAGLSRSYVRAWFRTFGELGRPVGTLGSCKGILLRTTDRLTAAVLRLPTDPTSCTGNADGRRVSLTSLPVGWTVREL